MSVCDIRQVTQALCFNCLIHIVGTKTGTLLRAVAELLVNTALCFRGSWFSTKENKNPRSPSCTAFTKPCQLLAAHVLSCNIGWQLASQLDRCFVWSLVLFFTAGSRFWFLDLTALRVDYKARGRKQNTPSSIPSGHVSSASMMSVLGQRHWWTTTTPEKRKRRILQSVFPVKEQRRRLGICSPVALRNVLFYHQLCRAPVPKLLVILFICVSIFHSCMSLLHRCGSKWPKATGFMDTEPGATT